MKVPGQKFLTFNLEGDGYGIPVQNAREIVRMMEITIIPKSPSFIKGVINLRGEIIPVVDLRIKFGLEEMTYNSRTCIIISEIMFEDKKRIMGIIVDSVSDVINITDDNVQPPPQFCSNFDTGFMLGLGKYKDKVILLLNLDTVLNYEELILINEVRKGVVHYD